MTTRTMIAWLALIGLTGCDRGSLRTGRAGTKVFGPEALPPETQVAAAMNRTITSRSDKAGEAVTATVTADVKNGRGQVVIPAGSTVELRITQLEPARNKSQSDGRLAFEVLAVSVHGQRYPANGEVTSVPHTLKGRGVTAGEAEKVGVGTVVGAVAGRVIGGNAKGTLIGGAVGAAGGTAVAIETASRDVVVNAGTPVTITLTSPLSVSRN